MKTVNLSATDIEKMVVDIKEFQSSMIKIALLGLGVNKEMMETVMTLAKSLPQKAFNLIYKDIRKENIFQLTTLLHFINKRQVSY